MTRTPAFAALAIFAALSYSNAQDSVSAAPANSAPVKDNSDQGIQLGTPIHTVVPRLPNKLHGKNDGVILSGTLGVDGSFSDLSALAGDRDFEEAALDAVHQWRYTPATLEGSSVDAPVFIAISYADGDVKTKLELNPPFPAKPKVPTSELYSRGELFFVDQKTMKLPKATFSPDPEYSEIARMVKYQGVCVVGLILGKDGLVSDAWVTRKLGFGLDQKALEAVRQWKFDPAMKDGKPVPVLLNVEVQFRLYDSAPGASTSTGKDVIPVPAVAEPPKASPTQQNAEASPLSEAAPPAPIIPGALIRKIVPRYPKEARKSKVEGEVELKATIEKNGDVSEISIVRGDMTLAEEAVNAVRNWMFDPYSQGSTAVKVTQNIVFKFSSGRKEPELEPFPPAVLVSRPAAFSSATKVYRIGGGISAPRAIYSPDPPYDEKARKAKYQGVCVLSLIVTPEGTPRDIHVVHAIGQGLDEKAIEAVSKWKFDPAMKDGKPVAVAINIEVTFRLY